MIKKYAKWYVVFNFVNFSFRNPSLSRVEKYYTVPVFSWKVRLGDYDLSDPADDITAVERDVLVIIFCLTVLSIQVLL